MARRVARLAPAIQRSVDSRPIVGPFAGYKGLVGLVGDSGTSFRMAPAVGRALAEFVTGGDSEFDLTPFHASRFDRGGRGVDPTETAPSASISR